LPCYSYLIPSPNELPMKYFILAFSFFVSIAVPAQVRKIADSVAVKSISGIVNKMLDMLSGEKGKIRDWNALSNLFLPTATFTCLNHPNDSMPKAVETISLTEFIQLLHDEYYENGYLEYETGSVINQYNGIATVFQGFYGKDSEGKEERGINTYQLVFFDSRWWIASVLWTTASNGVAIPKKYLKK